MIIATNPKASKAICKVSPMWNEFDFFISKVFLVYNSIRLSKERERAVSEGGILL